MIRQWTRANCIASDRPIPLDAPVIHTTLFDKDTEIKKIKPSESTEIVIGNGDDT